MDGGEPLLRRERPCRSGLREVMDGAVCVGTPTDEVELRCVFAGAGVTSLEPDELTVSGMVPSTLTAAAAMRPVYEEVESDTDRVRLIAGDFPKQYAAYARELGSLSLQSLGRRRSQNQGWARCRLVAPTLPLRGRSTSYRRGSCWSRNEGGPQPCHPSGSAGCNVFVRTRVRKSFRALARKGSQSDNPTALRGTFWRPQDSGDGDGCLARCMTKSKARNLRRRVHRLSGRAQEGPSSTLWKSLAISVGTNAC